MNVKHKKILYTFGFPFSPFYAQLMRFRSYLYAKNIFRVNELSVPVISIGNLTMGGTGKTPLVIYVADILLQKGYKPAVISRGYRGASKNQVNIVSDGNQVIMNSQDAGDEPLLIATSLPECFVLTGKKRIHPAQFALNNFKPDVLVLDDGFQHLSVGRSLDIVLFDTDVFAGNSRVFPGGDLREPVSALQRSDVIALTGVQDDNRQRAEKCCDLLVSKFPQKSVLLLENHYDTLNRYVYANGQYLKQSVDPGDTTDKLYGFCGIANPQRFIYAASHLSIKTLGMKTFRDHHRYSQEDLDQISTLSIESGANGLLTTEKDIVKIVPHLSSDIPIYTLPLRVKPNEKLDTILLNSVESFSNDN